MLRYSPILQSAKGMLKVSSQLVSKSYYRQYKSSENLPQKSLDSIARSQLILGAFVSGLSTAFLRYYWNIIQVNSNDNMDLTQRIMRYFNKNHFTVYAQKGGTVSPIDLSFPFEDDYEDNASNSDPAEVMRKYIQEATAAYDRAIKVLDLYSSKVETMMNRCPEGCIDQGLWEEIETIAAEKFDAELRLKEYVRRLDATIGQEAENALRSLENKKKKYQEQKERAETASKFWFKVTKGRLTFVNEIEALFPFSDLEKNVICAAGGDVDALLVIALRKICLLQNEISKVDCDLHSKIHRCLENKVDCKAIDDRIETELKKERVQLESYYKKKLKETCEGVQNELTKKLKMAEIDFEKCLHRTLVENTDKVLSEERRKEAEYMATHRLMMDQKMRVVLDRLTDLDSALKVRSDADKMSQQAQKLWIATEALDEALKGRSVRSSDARTCIGKELDAIRDSAADTDELVKAVLGGVSTTVRNRGILTETVLRERFKTVEKACRDFALAPEGAKGLPLIFISKMASCIVARPKISPRASKTDDSLDNYELIEKVKNHVEEGKWDKVYHYMRLMKGGANDVSKDWVTEVMLHLQVRLASDAIQAHAAAMGLLRQ